MLLGIRETAYILRYNLDYSTFLSDFSGLYVINPAFFRPFKLTRILDTLMRSNCQQIGLFMVTVEWSSGLAILACWQRKPLVAPSHFAAAVAAASIHFSARLSLARSEAAADSFACNFCMNFRGGIAVRRSDCSSSGECASQAASYSQCNSELPPS